MPTISKTQRTVKLKSTKISKAGPASTPPGGLKEGGEMIDYLFTLLLCITVFVLIISGMRALPRLLKKEEK